MRLRKYEEKESLKNVRTKRPLKTYGQEVLNKCKWFVLIIN